jgi:Putative auto-transporter adhesin, head GIN domain
MRLFKKITVIAIIILTFIIGWNKIYISEQEREILPFHSIYTSGPINVYIQQSEHESVVVRSDTNILDNVITEVVNGELKIYSKGSIKHERVLDVYVNYKSLDSIHASGPSTITGRGILNSSKLKIKMSVAAEIKLQIESESLQLVMNDAANVQLAGKVNYFNFKITNVGDLMAYNLISQHCKAIINTGNQSPGYARINVEQTLDISIKGPRLLKYKGNPIISKKLIEGNGKLIQN